MTTTPKPARKLVDIDDLRTRANTMLAVPDSTQHDMVGDPVSFRWGVISLIEQVLFMTDRYKGFRHLDSEWDTEAWKLRDGYDDTRRRYL